MNDRLRFLLKRIQEKLWVKPLIFCLFSIGAAFIAKAADSARIGRLMPEIKQESVEVLLQTIASSMLVISTFAVGAMITSFNSASNTATPRSFKLIVSDDVTQNALSVFIGSLIFSVVGLVTIKNDFYQAGGIFALFVLTIAVFTIVILTFIRWVDRIAKLGRLPTVIGKLEQATTSAFQRWTEPPLLGGIAQGEEADEYLTLYGKIGYVQSIDMVCLQECAKAHDLVIRIVAIPGAFTSPGKPLMLVEGYNEKPDDKVLSTLEQSFVIGKERTFDDDPNYGLIALSEISSRALSPAINDPGTAIFVIDSLVRIFSKLDKTLVSGQVDKDKVKFDRIMVPNLSFEKLYRNAFSAIGREGAGKIEVVEKLIKALVILRDESDKKIKPVIQLQLDKIVSRAKKALDCKEDRQVLEAYLEQVSSGSRNSDQS